MADAERPVHGAGNQQAAKQAQPELLAMSMRTNVGKDHKRIAEQIASTAWGEEKPATNDQCRAHLHHEQED